MSRVTTNMAEFGGGNLSGVEGTDFIGMDPLLAKRNIDDFKDRIVDLQINFCNAISDLFDELYYAWASPKAVEFYNKYISECNSLYTTMIQAEYAISQGAWRAYNLMARATGNDTIPDDYNYDANSNLGGKFTSILPFVDNKFGKSGMNVNLVKNFILPAFEISVGGLSDLVDYIPTSIALYDAEGDLSGAYATGISGMKTKIETLISDIKTSIETAITEEADNMLLAKQQSTDAMTNMNA